MKNFARVVTYIYKKRKILYKRCIFLKHLDKHKKNLYNEVMIKKDMKKMFLNTDEIKTTKTFAIIEKWGGVAL